MPNEPNHSFEVSTTGERDVVVMRRFDAPAALVWRCYMATGIAEGMGISFDFLNDLLRERPR